MDDYLDVEIDVFDHTAQHARVRRSISIAILIQEILDQFDDVPAEAPEKYALYLKGADRPLRLSGTLEQLDIQPHDELVFEYSRPPIREMLDPKDQACLREETTGKSYDIQWQPALIGRPGSDVSHNLILAVNLQSLPNSITVSHRHAQITFSAGRYYLEPLAEHNPVLLNGEEIPLNSTRPLRNKDRISIGRHKISLVFETRRTDTSTWTATDSRAAQAGPPQPSTPTPPVSPATAGTGTPLQPSREPSTPRLVIERGSMVEHIGQVLAIDQYPFLLGRSLDLLSGEKEISRKHAEISYDARKKKFFVTDLKSTNGVTVDGVRIPPEKPVEIEPGCVLGLGRMVLLRFNG